MINIPFNLNSSINFDNKIAALYMKNSTNQLNNIVCNIERNYEIKNVYYDSKGNNITNNNSLWKDHLINKSIIKFKWDNKTNIFAFDFSFLENNVVSEINFKINNEKKFTFKPKFNWTNNTYNQTIYSNEIGNNSYNIQNIKTIQITLKGSITKVINLIIGPYNQVKYDFIIPKKGYLFLNFQNSITIKGEEIKNTFSSLKFSPCNLAQGVWNKDVLRLEEEQNEIFDRNDVLVKSLENLPISETAKSTFEAYIDSNSNIGFVKLNQNTYYDLNKKETIKGFGENSNEGYIVPFEFSGTFFPIITLKINNLDFKISWEVNFDKPYFKKNEGINKIYINNSYKNDQDIEWTTISSELMNEAKEYNFTFNELMQWLTSKENEIL